MARRDTPARESQDLDLTGFRTRMPRAVLEWYMDRLGPGELLRIRLDSANQRELVLTTVRCCGGEPVRKGPGRGEQDMATVLVRSGKRRTVTQELDTRGMRCPVPVIEARRRLRKMSAGEVLKLIADCTRAATEVETWVARANGPSLLGMSRQGADRFFFLGWQ